MNSSSRCLASLAAIALSLAVLLSCSRSAAETTISQADLADRIVAERAPLILDVRTASEFASGHIPGAVNIPHNELRRRIGDLDASSDREIVVYCEVGGRAEKAAYELRKAGFTAVLHLQGDMRAWRERQLPCTGC
jgi:rhodanese-related sulfurtransferase